MSSITELNPAAHVLHELDFRTGKLHHGKDEDEGGNHETGHENKENNDLEILEAHDVLGADNDDPTTIPTDTNIFESLDSSIATHYIFSQMTQSQGLQ